MTGRRIVVFGDVIDDIVVVPSGPIRVDTDTPSSIRVTLDRVDGDWLISGFDPV